MTNLSLLILVGILTAPNSQSIDNIADILIKHYSSSSSLKATYYHVSSVRLSASSPALCQHSALLLLVAGPGLSTADQQRLGSSI